MRMAAIPALAIAALASGCASTQMPPDIAAKVRAIGPVIDSPPFVAQAKLLNDALCREGRCPRSPALAGHSHISEMYAVNTSDTSLTDPLMKFVTR